MENFRQKSTRCCAKVKKIPQNTILCGMCEKVRLVNMHNFTAFSKWKEMEIVHLSGGEKQGKKGRGPRAKGPNDGKARCKVASSK